jgi:uncharacterized protein involved in type VI secretion and phage assembly
MTEQTALLELVAGGSSFGKPWPAGYLAEVVSVKDPDNLARVEIRLLSFDGVGAQDAAVWARVAAPFAGSDRGAFFLPDVGDEVFVVFANGDARFPVVVGGLWNGKAKPKEQLGGSGDSVDRWTIVGKKGTRIAIVEESSGQPTISFTTPGNVSGKLTDEGGGKIELQAAGATVTIDSSGVSIQTGSKVQVKASQMDVTAGQVNVNAAISKFSGMVKCDVLQATTVIGSTYTPGVGNVW